MEGWMDEKAVLRIAYINKNTSRKVTGWKEGWMAERLLHVLPTAFKTHKK
jgi:hypothetical protein